MKLNKCNLNKNITFIDVDEEPFEVNALNLKVYTDDDGRIVRAHLSFLIPFAKLKYAESEELFNNMEEIRSQSFDEFDPNLDVEFECALDHDRVAEIAENADSAATACEFLLSRAQDAPLLETESWHALNVKQQREGGLKTGYSTEWMESDLV